MNGSKQIKKKTRLPGGYTSLNKAGLIRGGKPYFDCLLQMIASAEESIHLQTYIYENDPTGQLVAAALKEAAQRQVKVYLLLDGYASKALPKSFINELREAGVHFRFFSPIFKSSHFYFGRRLHHKVTVVDARHALVGGVNISDRYNDITDKPAWLDFAIYVEGEAAKQLCVLCWESWKNYPATMGTTPCEKNNIHFSIPKSETSKIAIRRNDWVRRKNEISSVYIQMFRQAESHITILCSYFLPGRVIRRQLAHAAKRGIQIRVITAGLSDIKLAKYAERYMYHWMLKRQIQIYEYQPNILHGKIAVCDNEWLTIGSYNINDISAYASIELNMDVRDPAFAKETEEMLQQIIDKDCICITPEYYKRTKNIFNQFARWLSYKFFRVIFYLFTFYFKRIS